MRFFLAGTAAAVEVIGEVVSLPNAGGEVFAVHHAVIPGVTDDDDDDAPLFAVSHVETGFRVASGFSIDEAIEAAGARLQSKTPEEIQERLAHARTVLAKRRGQ